MTWPAESRRSRFVDERTGEYGGVRMGDSIDDVRRVLGEDAGGSGFAPARSVTHLSLPHGRSG